MHYHSKNMLHYSVDSIESQLMHKMDDTAIIKLACEIESQLLIEKSEIYTAYRMNDLNCFVDVTIPGDMSTTRCSLSVWPYVLIIELTNHSTFISVINEFECVTNYELSQHMVLLARKMRNRLIEKKTSMLLNRKNRK